MDFTLGKLRRAQSYRCRLGGEFELVAVHVVAVGDLVAHFERIRVERPCRKLERHFGRKQVLRGGKPVQAEGEQQRKDSKQIGSHRRILWRQAGALARVSDSTQCK